MKVPTPEEVLSMDDAELGEFLGHGAARKDLREELTKMTKLEGKAKEEAYEMWENRLRPSLDSYSVRWMIEDAQRAVDPKKVLDSTEVESGLY